MKTLFRITLLVLCLSLGVLALLGSLDTVSRRMGTEALHRLNDDYLSKSFDKALVGFGVMSGIKAGLAVIEGSTAGVSAGATVHLQVGDVVQSAYDYIDIAWRTLLIGCISLLSIQYLIEAADLVAGWVLGVTLFVLALHLLFDWWAPGKCRTRQTLRDVLSVCLVGTLALFYILPLSVWGASQLSSRITRPAITEAQAGFAQTRDTLFPEEEELPDGTFARVRKIPERIQQIAEHLKTRSKEMAVWTIQLIAGYIFDCIVFPLGVFFILLGLTRCLLKYLFHRNLHTTLREDVCMMLKK